MAWGFTQQFFTQQFVQLGRSPAASRKMQDGLQNCSLCAQMGGLEAGRLNGTVDGIDSLLLGAERGAISPPGTQKSSMAMGPQLSSTWDHA